MPLTVRNLKIIILVSAKLLFKILQGLTARITDCNWFKTKLFEEADFTGERQRVNKSAAPRQSYA